MKVKTVSSEPEFDLEILDEVQEELEEEFGDCVQGFLTDATGWAQAIGIALESADATSLYENAHALKSSSGYLGAIGLQAMAGELESLGGGGTTIGANEVFSQLKAELKRVGDYLLRLT